LKLNFSLLLIFFIPTLLFAQLNLLSSKSDRNGVASVLLTTSQWINYPAYTEREAWQKILGEKAGPLINLGEKYINYEWKVVKATDYLAFERTGSRVIMETPFEQNNTALTFLFMAELAEGKGRFIDQLINGIWHTCEMSTWVMSAHLQNQRSRRSLPDTEEVIIDLSSGDLGSMLSWMHYFLAPSFDKVNPVVAARIRKEVKSRILDPYLKRNDFWWMALSNRPDQMVNNWNPWCNFNALTCFLLMEKDELRQAEAVHKTMVSTDKFINYTKEDGACEEGPTYWGHAAGKMYDYLQLLHYATGGRISIFDQPKICRMGEYISRSYIGNGWVVNFADASAKGGGDAGLIYRYGVAVMSEELKSFAAYLRHREPESNISRRDLFRTFEELVHDDEMAAVLPALPTATATWYPQTQFCYLRKGDVFFGAKGGYNAESHNHNDAGSFVYYYKNKPFLIDAGVGTYTKFTFSEQRYTIWTMQSDYHNLPRINGVSQKDGREFKAREVSFDPGKSQLEMDIASAYPIEADVLSWKLTYTLLDNGILRIGSRYQLGSSKQANAHHLLVAVAPQEMEPGKIKLSNGDATVVIHYDPKRFAATLDRIAIDDIRLSRVWGSSIYRIRLTEHTASSIGNYTIEVNPQ